MRILGIDPGLAIVGWGVIEYNRNHFTVLGSGAITTPAHTPVETRLAMIYDDANELIRNYRPEVMAVEELFFNTNTTTGISVAEARGVILLSAMQNQLKIAEYTPLQVKQAVVGYGRAEKHQVIAMVTRLLNLPAPPKPDDTADALAIAVCHAHSSGSLMGSYFNR